MPKIIRILRSCSMKIFSKFPTVNISKLNVWLLICIAKNFIWTTLKVIFSIFRFFCTLRFQIFKYCPIITNHTSMESYLFSFQMMYKSQFRKIDTYDWFCAPGSHINFIVRLLSLKSFLHNSMFVAYSLQTDKTQFTVDIWCTKECFSFTQLNLFVIKSPYRC